MHNDRASLKTDKIKGRLERSLFRLKMRLPDEYFYSQKNDPLLGFLWLILPEIVQKDTP